MYHIARKFGVLKFGKLTSKEVWRLKFWQNFNSTLAASMEPYPETKKLVNGP